MHSWIFYKFWRYENEFGSIRIVYVCLCLCLWLCLCECQQYSIKYNVNGKTPRHHFKRQINYVFQNWYGCSGVFRIYKIASSVWMQIMCSTTLARQRIPIYELSCIFCASHNWITLSNIPFRTRRNVQVETNHLGLLRASIICANSFASLDCVQCAHCCLNIFEKWT